MEEDNKKVMTYQLVSKYRGALMGLAILGIIAFHFAEDCASNGVHFNRLISLYYKYIKSTGVDIFLFLSGFGLYFSFKKNSNLRIFYKRRFSKILIPYILLSVPALIWQCFFWEDGGVSQFLSEVFFVSFFRDGFVWFWYVLMISFCYLIFPYVYRIFEQSADRTAEQMNMMSVFSFLTVIALVLQLYQKEFFGNTEIALLRLPVFFLGCLVGKAAFEKRKVSNFMWLLVVISILILPLSQETNIIVSRYVLAFFNLMLFWLITAAFQCLSVCKKIHSILKHALEVIGSYSYELYLSHVMARGVFHRLGYKTCYVKNELVMLIISVILAIILKWASNRILKLGCLRT